MKVPLFTLSRIPEAIQRDIEQGVFKVLRSGELSHGRYATNFEALYADKTGYKHCLLMSSGTDALLAIALYRKSKDKLQKIYVPALTFIATLAPSAIIGGDIQYVDVDDTGNIDLPPNVYNNESATIIAVSLYGNVVDLKTIRAVFSRAYLIHDSSQCAGGNLAGMSFANWADAEATSFYITKNLAGVTEGGCLLTNDPDLYSFSLGMRNHGRVGNNYEFNSYGLNLRSSEINAIALTTKLQYLDEWNDERIRVAKQYQYNLSSCSNIRIPLLDNGNRNVYHLFPVFVRNRDKVREELEKRGISTGKHYPSLPDQPLYQGKYADEFPNARKLGNSVITLPLFTGITASEIEYVSENLIEAVEANSL